jgi:hypothetical protein
VPPTTHLLLPDTMSFINDPPCAYSAGLTKPTDPFPSAMRAAFTLEKKAATAGAEAEVPHTVPLPPPIITA